MSQLPAWVDRYRGKPFRRDADGPDAFDCYGLVRAVLRDQWGAETPALDGAWHLAAAQSLALALDAPEGPWVEVDGAPRPGDVLAFVADPAGELHVAIVVGPGWVLQATETRGVETARLDRVEMAATWIRPAFRHRALCAKGASA